MCDALKSRQLSRYAASASCPVTTQRLSRWVGICHLRVAEDDSHDPTVVDEVRWFSDLEAPENTVGRVGK